LWREVEICVEVNDKVLWGENKAVFRYSEEIHNNGT
jgi:hypothetical protein